MRRGRVAWRLALLAGLGAAATAGMAADEREAHRHSGLLFQLRVEPDLNDNIVYRAFLTDHSDPASLLIERGEGYLGDAGRIDLRAAACPALRRAVEALGTLPLPAVELGEGRPYDMRAPRGVNYDFHGFVHFPNGGEGEASFIVYEVPGQAADPQLSWARGFVRAFEACRPRTG